MKQYHELVRHVLEHGINKADRTGIGTLSIFGYQLRFNLAEGFPLLTTKKLHIKSIIYELLWILRGDTNIKYLVDHDVKIWNEWAFQAYLERNKLDKVLIRYSDEWKEALDRFAMQVKDDAVFAAKYGDLGPVYGQQWMRWKAADGREINQIQEVINLIENDPTSRRLIVSAWNVGEVQELVRSHHHAPPLCHTLFQFMVINGTLSCQLYQRSADIFLGVPFNIASYALLTMMVAQVTGLRVGEFIHTIGDAHLYQNHIEQANELLLRTPRPLPHMHLNPERKRIEDFIFEDFTLEGYDPYPTIKAPIAV